MKTTKKIKLESGVEIECTGIVSRSSVRLFDGSRSWEIEIRPELANSTDRLTAMCNIAPEDWKPGRRSKYEVPAKYFAFWLKEALEDDLIMIRPISCDGPRSGICDFFKEFGTRQLTAA